MPAVPNTVATTAAVHSRSAVLQVGSLPIPDCHVAVIAVLVYSDLPALLFQPEKEAIATCWQTLRIYICAEAFVELHTFTNHTLA